MLDDRERRILDDTELDLAQTDPVLAGHFRRHSLPTRERRALPAWLVVSILLAAALLLVALPAVVASSPPAAACTSGRDAPSCPGSGQARKDVGPPRGDGPAAAPTAGRT